MKPDPIKFFEEKFPPGCPELPAIVRLTRYVKFSDWHTPGAEGPATEEDFRAAQKSTDRFAEYLTRRGIKVVGVNFDLTQYRTWLGHREDTRNARAEWATAPERPIEIAFNITYNAIGWAVISSS